MSTEPYVRPLNHHESRQIWKKIQERWGANCGPWYPLISTNIPKDVMAFEADWFYYEIPLHVLQSMLEVHGITHIYELREPCGFEYEMDLELFEPYYNGDEGFWTSENIDWLVYASHERSLTVAGEWLITAIQATWPNWEQHLWRDYDFQGPPGGFSLSVRGRKFFQS